MSVIDKIRAKAAADVKHVVLAEGSEPRTVQAAAEIVKLGLAKITLVGAKAEIYKLILGFAEQGKTVIINTLEIPEIQKVADRCIVFYEGSIIRTFQHEEVNEHDVMLYSTNAIETIEEAAK